MLTGKKRERSPEPRPGGGSREDESRDEGGASSASTETQAVGSSGPAAPSWKGAVGERRVLKEFMALKEGAANGNGVSQVFDLELVGDNIRLWRFKLKGFDDGTEGGRQLNEDLRILGLSHGQEYLLMEVAFPEDYPTQPFFLRVVTPRCKWYTGHVTAGGSICIEALTLSGTANSWQPDYCVESVLHIVVSNMVDCERVQVRTLTGPGGLSGPLRVDLDHRYCCDVMTPYSEFEAKAAFKRMERNHNQFGWGSSRN